MNIQNRKRVAKGSVLVFSLIILSIMLSAALSILSVTLMEKKSSFSTEKSVQAFDVAQSGMELVTQEMWKDVSLTDFSSLNTAISGNACAISGGVVSITKSIAGGTTELTFKDVDGADVTDCGANVSTIASVRSVGTFAGSSRAIEIAVRRCFTRVMTTNPRDIVFDSNTKSVWTNADLATLSKIDVSTGAIVDYSSSAKTHKGSVGMAFDDHTDSVWIANYDDHTVSQVNTDTGATTTSVAIPSAASHPYGVAYDPIEQSVWVTDDLGKVYKIDVNNPPATAAASTSVGNTPLGVAYGDGFVWVANAKDDTVSKVDARTGAVKSTFNVTKNPYGVAYDSATKSVWVTSSASKEISIIDTTVSGSVSKIAGAAAANGPRGIAFDPITSSIWVADYSDTAVTRIDVSTKTVALSVSLSNHPSGVAYDPATKSVWVTDGTSAVYKIDLMCSND